MEISVPMLLVITVKADVFSSDCSCVDGLITLKMNMKACFGVINSVDRFIFYLWEVPMCLFLEG